MPVERNPSDPYDRDRVNNLSPDPFTAEMRSRPPFDEDLQADPELAEGPASSTRIALFAVGIAIVLGAVFYGLNNSSMRTGDTTSTAQNAAPMSPPAAPPGMRDVTPRSNSAPGTTTGAAPVTPPMAPAAPANPASK
jgi:type IV secretory pathway VirB10-like protein